MVLGVVRVIPGVGPLVAGLAGLWTLYLSFVAIKSALDIESGKTVATILISVIPSAIISLLLLATLVGNMI